MAEAAPIALESVVQALPPSGSLVLLRFILFDASALAAYEKALSKLAQRHSDLVLVKP
jgi:hypothetical protein